MTFSFEMRSGREHNTPDKAMWGFSVTVRAQVGLDYLSFLLNFYCWFPQQTTVHIEEQKD